MAGLLVSIKLPHALDKFKRKCDRLSAGLADPGVDSGHQWKLSAVDLSGVLSGIINIVNYFSGLSCLSGCL